jgi:phospholipid-binding lipoprotein MlaA
MTVYRHYLFPAFILFFAIFLAGCAGLSGPNKPRNMDPLEAANRAIYGFNENIDRVVFRPAAEIYRDNLPQPLQTGVSNFFRNLAEPTTIVNNLLQGKILHAVNDSARFVINTSLGVFGLIDIAGSLGLLRHQEDYGQTLASWGVPAGPYLVLPLFGPNNLRDALGKLPAFYLTDPLFVIADEPFLKGGQYGMLHGGFRTLHAVDLRAQLLPTDRLIRMQLDPYLFVRESYRQRRIDLIRDGQQPEDGLESFLEDELFDD